MALPLIPNLPPALLMEHRNWHRAHHQQMMNPGPGYGIEFLEFHRDYIGRVLNWYAASGLDPRLVEPWLSVPEPIRQSYCYDKAAEDRVMRHPETFRSADELGIFIVASGLHGCMHEQGALLFGEPGLNDFDVASGYTTFYRIHGLIDQWYRNWEGQGQFRVGVTHWCGKFDTSDGEVLYYRPQDDSWWLGVPQPQLREGSRADQRGVKLEWTMAGSSRMFGPMGDGRPFQVRDIDGDGRREIVFFDQAERHWKKGKLSAGRIRWGMV